MSSPSPDWHGRDRHGRNRAGRDRRGRDWAGRDWAGSDWRGGDWDGADESGAERARADWARGAWAGPGSDAERRTTERRQGPVRIGDAERDQAVSLLSDHFVAGRLTQTEFEERSEQATRARYVDDLEPLFDDLPSSAELQLAQGPWSPQTVRSRRRTGPPPPFVMLAPFLMIGLVITAITLTAPWLLWGMFWIMLISGASRRRWYHQNR
ncbi:DUF1707 domain-containing protein [Kribbella sp. NPDC026596]|uniref:DUF1707 SHOCT-like domain-containing protein n=1 Tax=Kribbella sp. NPDC026596 TaxID=3155122 RepID=UPI003400C743